MIEVVWAFCWGLAAAAGVLGGIAAIMSLGGALIAMSAETMIPEAFHNGPRYSAFSPLRASQL